MSWLAFSILAYAALGLQTGLSVFVRWGSAEPNFGLLAVVFICINAERQAALLGGFALGALQDLATQQPFGLYAFSYGLAAMLIVRAAHSVYREHPLTHLSCALLAGCVTSLVLLLHSRLHHGTTPAGMIFSGTLYTALLAPFLIGALQKMKRVFVFRR
jgi:rod shape-determining protein MreD